MSHHTPVMSPAGTPLEERTVGELVAERPGRSRIFQERKIDFCCGGGRPLREACEKLGAPLDAVLGQLEAELAGPVDTTENPAELPPAELVDYIVETHHGLLRRELPRLHEMSERVARVHGGHTPSLVELFRVFQELEGEMVSHMMKEEGVLFPAIKQMSGGNGAPMPLDGPIACMIHEHEHAGDCLGRIRDLTNDHTAPPEACNTYRALFAGLADMEKDLQLHIHLENSVLFPAAEAMAVGEVVA